MKERRSYRLFVQCVTRVWRVFSILDLNHPIFIITHFRVSIRHVWQHPRCFRISNFGVALAVHLVGQEDTVETFLHINLQKKVSHPVEGSFPFSRLLVSPFPLSLPSRRTSMLIRHYVVIRRMHLPRLCVITTCATVQVVRFKKMSALVAARRVRNPTRGLHVRLCLCIEDVFRENHKLSFHVDRDPCCSASILHKMSGTIEFVAHSHFSDINFSPSHHHGDISSWTDGHFALLRCVVLVWCSENLCAQVFGLLHSGLSPFHTARWQAKPSEPCTKDESKDFHTSIVCPLDRSTCILDVYQCVHKCRHNHTSFIRVRGVVQSAVEAKAAPTPRTRASSTTPPSCEFRVHCGDLKKNNDAQRVD